MGDSNPRYGCPYVSLANWWFQPLTQPSKGGRLFVKRSAKVDNTPQSCKLSTKKVEKNCILRSSRRRSSYLRVQKSHFHAAPIFCFRVDLCADSHGAGWSAPGSADEPPWRAMPMSMERNFVRWPILIPQRSRLHSNCCASSGAPCPKLLQTRRRGANFVAVTT